MLFLILLFLIPNIICHEDYQTIPLRYDAAINYLKQFHYNSFVNLLGDVSTYSITSDKMSSYISLFSNNETTQCDRDFEIIAQAAMKYEMWALKTLDAWGKPLPSGILKGNIYWVGSYDECLQPMYFTNNKTFTSQPFDTQYCTLISGSTLQIIYSTPDFVLGLCVPSSCNKQDVVSLVYTLFGITNITEDNLVCSNDPPNGQKGFTRGAIATIVILSFLGLFVLVGTIIDLILMSRPKSDAGITGRVSTNLPRYSRSLVQTSIDTTHRIAFLAEFSALKSLRRIFTMKQNNDNESYLFINGIRVLSLFWVIIGHSFMFGIIFTSNTLDVLIWTRNVAFQLILSAIFSVDTFWVLSGFLTSILFVRKVEKEGKLSFYLMFLYYLHRYIRLTPTFLIIVMISINLTPYFGNGPIYPSQQGFETNGCRTQYWWTSILYVGNIVQADDMCLSISWYLYNDMQFHWIAPLSLIPFALGRKTIAFIISVLFILVGIGTIAGLFIQDSHLFETAGFTVGPEVDQTGRTYVNTIYYTPWCRLSAYFVGVLTGFVVINTGRSYRMNKYILILCSIIAILFALGCIFGLYPDYILVPRIDRTSFIVYQSLSRTLWSLAIGWLLFLCSINQCRIVNKILSCPIWAPLSRLNYAAYLVHSTVILIIVTNQRMPFYYQPHLAINSFVSQIFFSYVTAIVVVIFIETPFFIIEKKLFKR